MIKSQSELAVTQFVLIEYLLPVGYYKPQVLPAPHQVIELTTVSGREATGPTMKGPSGNVDEELPYHTPFWPSISRFEHYTALSRSSVFHFGSPTLTCVI